MKLCANISMLFTEHPLAERIAAAQAAGFKAVEIQFPYELPLAQWQQILASTPIQVALINLPAGDLMSGGEGLAAVPSKRHEFRQALNEGLRYAQALNVDAVNILPGRCTSPSQLADYRATLLDNLRLAASELETLGIRACFEAINNLDMPGFIVSNLQQVQEVLDRAQQPNLYMQYDCYHMQRMGEDIARQLPDIIERIGHIQFADCPGRGQPGSGDMDYPTIFKRLEQLQYRYWLGAEYHPKTPSTVDSLDWRPLIED